MTDAEHSGFCVQRCLEQLRVFYVTRKKDGRKSELYFIPAGFFPSGHPNSTEYRQSLFEKILKEVPETLDEPATLLPHWQLRSYQNGEFPFWELGDERVIEN